MTSFTLLLTTRRKSFEEPRAYGKRSWNFRVNDNCPLDGKCLNKCIVYQANVIANNKCKEYFGTAEGEFKLRYSNYTMSFRHKKGVKIYWVYKIFMKTERIKRLLQIYSGASKRMDPRINVG